MELKKMANLKLTLSFILVSLISILTIGLVGFFSVKKIMEKTALNTFEAIRETKKQQIEMYFNTFNNQCKTAAQDLMIVDAMKEFKKGFNSIHQNLQYSPEQIAKHSNSLKSYYHDKYLVQLNANTGKDQTVKDYFGMMPDVTKILQYLYISNNLNPVGQKENLDDAKDGSSYSKTHAKYHPILKEYLKNFKYYDIFFIDIETGSIVYTCYKEVDFATNLLDGPFKKTNIAKLFLKIQEDQKPGVSHLVDFDVYNPSYGKAAAFVGAPIFDQNKKIGALIFQIPIDQINNITTNNQNWQDTGMGKSGEIYLIGQDYKMRTDSRFLLEDPDNYFLILEKIGTRKDVINKLKLLKSSILIQEINTKASRQVIRGNTDTLIIEDYRSIPVISSFTPIDLIGLKWGLIAEVDHSEALQPIYTVGWTIFFWGIGILGLISILGFMWSYVILNRKR